MKETHNFCTKCGVKKTEVEEAQIEVEGNDDDSRVLGLPPEPEEMEKMMNEVISKMSKDEYEIFKGELAKNGKEMEELQKNMELGKISVEESTKRFNALANQAIDLARKWERRRLIKKNHPDKGGTDEELKKILDETED